MKIIRSVMTIILLARFFITFVTGVAALLRAFYINKSFLLFLMSVFALAFSDLGYG
jgi:hypothetical protein